MDRVVLEKMGERVVVRQVVDGYELHVGASLLEGGSQNVPADTAEPVDGNTYRHRI